MYADRSVQVDAIDDVHERDDFDYTRGDSIVRPDMCPYDRNLFLDSDTVVCRPIDDVFDALDRFDLLVTHSPGRVSVDELPRCIPEFNTGVIAYRRTPSVNALFERWHREYEQQRTDSDDTRNQGPFTRALWEVDVDCCVLPREYNLRVPRAAYLNGPVRIIHGRHWEGLDTLGERLNARTDERVYYRNEVFGIGHHRIVDRKGPWRLTRDVLREYGLKGTLKLCWKRIRST